MIALKLQNLVNHKINKVLICIELISVGVAGSEPLTKPLYKSVLYDSSIKVLTELLLPIF